VNAKGVFYGLTPDTQRADLASATLDGVPLNRAAARTHRRVPPYPACPGTVSPRSEHPRVSITANSATSPTAHAAIM
jgi:hypothetical protein